MSGYSPLTDTTTGRVSAWNATNSAAHVVASDFAPASIADIASAALTGSATTAAITATGGSSYSVTIAVTAVSGTNPTLDFTIEESSDGGVNWFKVFDFARITAAGIYRSPMIRLYGNRIRYVQTLGGTTPSFTRSVNRLQYSGSSEFVRQLVDRTVDPNTLSSVTPAIDARNGGNRLQLIVNMGATTTNPDFRLQGSDDNGATWYFLGAALTATANSTVQQTVNNQSTSLLRAIVTTAGTGATLGYCLVRTHD